MLVRLLFALFFLLIGFGLGGGEAPREEASASSGAGCGYSDHAPAGSGWIKQQK